MTSQKSSPCILLSQIFAQNEDEIKSNIPDVLPVLINSISHSNDDVSNLRALKILFGPCVTSIPLNDVEESLLQYIFPTCSDIFEKALLGIKNHFRDNTILTQSDVTEVLSNLLVLCSEVLVSINFTISYLMSQGSIDSKLVRSLPKATTYILYQAFLHCKESKEIYGDYFNELAEDISCLLHKSKETQINFLNFLCESVVFNCCVEEELNLLDDVLSLLRNIGECVMNLDVKTTADTWKAYTKLCEKYTDYLKRHHNVAKTISYLSNDIIQNLECIIFEDEYDIKDLLKSIKISSFALKIIVKLTEYFKGYLGNCQESLLNLLITLCGFSPPYLEYILVHCEVKEEIGKYLTIGAEPLLSNILADRGLVLAVNIFTTKKDFRDCHKVGFLLLFCNLFKKLINSSNEVQRLWFSQQDFNILKWTFTIVECSHSEMSWDIKVPGVMYDGKPRTFICLYESLLSYMSAFIMTTSCDIFHMIEQILLENILKPSVWCAILASDVWCLIARFGSSDLCLSHLITITRILTETSTNWYRPELCFLSSLATRLFSFLSKRQQEYFVDRFSPVHFPGIWQLFSVESLDEPLRSSVQNVLMTSVVQKFHEFFNSADRDNQTFKDLEQNILGACPILDSSTSLDERSLDLVKHCNDLWICLRFEYENSKFSHQWIRRIISITCHLTSCLIIHMNQEDIKVVLEHLKWLLLSAETVDKLLVVKVLYKLSVKVIEPSKVQTEIFKIVADIFYFLLRDKNIFVSERTFDVFSYFAHVTSHPEIIALSVHEDKLLQKELSSFLQREPFANRVDLSINEYLKLQSTVEFIHVCKHFDESERDEKMEVLWEGDSVPDPSCKKIKTMNSDENRKSVMLALDRLKDDCSVITSAACFLNETDKCKIKEVCDTLYSLI